MLLSSILKFGPMTQNFPELVLSSHTLNGSLKVVRETSGLAALNYPEVTRESFNIPCFPPLYNIILRDKR